MMVRCDRRMPKAAEQKLIFSVPDVLDVVARMAPALTREQVASAQVTGDYAIKSEKFAPALDTSEWPLLLKNYDKLLVRSSHFTPIPSGCSPLKRDLQSYVKCVPWCAFFPQMSI